MRTKANWLPETKWYKGEDDKQHIDVAAMLVHPDDQPEGVALCMTDQTIARYERRPAELRKHTVVHKRGECGDDVEKFFDAAAEVFDKPPSMRVQISGRVLRDIAALVPSGSQVMIELVCDDVPREFGKLDILLFGEPTHTHHSAYFNNAVRFRTDDGKTSIAVVGAATHARHIEQRVPDDYLASIVDRRNAERSIVHQSISEEDIQALDEVERVVDEFMIGLEEEEAENMPGETHGPEGTTTEKKKCKASARALRELRNKLR